jgi:hypothetical protein
MSIEGAQLGDLMATAHIRTEEDGGIIGQILEWLGDRELAVVAVDGRGYTITKTMIRTSGLDAVIHGFDASPPQWLASYLKSLRN